MMQQPHLQNNFSIKNHKMLPKFRRTTLIYIKFFSSFIEKQNKRNRSTQIARRERRWGGHRRKFKCTCTHRRYNWWHNYWVMRGCDYAICVTRVCHECHACVSCGIVYYIEVNISDTRFLCRCCCGEVVDCKRGVCEFDSFIVELIIFII